jgi:hypothetical protein
MSGRRCRMLQPPSKWFGTWLSIALAACASHDPHPSELPVEVVQRVGASGGSLKITSSDGTEVELRIPAGALEQEEEITLRRLPAVSWPSDTASNPVVGSTVLELLPEGLTFDEPVSMVTRFSSAPDTLGTDDRQIAPSHVSRSSAGTLERHPTTVVRRSDGSAALVASFSHFSIHWASTTGSHGEHGVDLRWPAQSTNVGTSSHPFSFGLWTTSASPPVHDAEFALFVESASSSILEPTPYETMDLSGEVVLALSGVLVSHFADLGLAKSIAANAIGASRSAAYLADGTFDFLVSDFPGLSCVGIGTGVAWIVVRLHLPDAQGNAIPVTFIHEVVVGCDPYSGPTDAGLGDDGAVDAGVDAGDDGGVDAGDDAGVDAGDDAAVDAGDDAGDAGDDAAVDAGDDAGDAG